MGGPVGARPPPQAEVGGQGVGPRRQLSLEGGLEESCRRRRSVGAPRNAAIGTNSPRAVPRKEAVIAERTGKRLKGLVEAADLLRLPVEAVRALVAAGYLLPSAEEPEGPAFAISDLKGFVARNADGGAAETFLPTGDPADPQALLEALDSRSEEMARKALDIFQAA